MRKLTIIAFFLLVAVQWYVNLNIIRSHQKVLDYGEAVTFQINPLWLNGVPYREEIQVTIMQYEVNMPNVLDYSSNMEVYVHFQSNKSGIFEPVHISKDRPTNVPFLKSRIAYIDEQASTIMLNYTPFRYTLRTDNVTYWNTPVNESYLEGTAVFLAEAKLYKGKVVITEITIDGIPLIDYFGAEIDER